MIGQFHHLLWLAEGHLDKVPHVLEFGGQVGQFSGHPIGIAIVAPLVETLLHPVQLALIELDTLLTASGIPFLTLGVHAWRDDGSHPEMDGASFGSLSPDASFLAPVSHSLVCFRGEFFFELEVRPPRRQQWRSNPG